VNKSQIRKKILKIRKNNFIKNLKINTNNFFSFLKINTNSVINLGGYYPSNYEIDDLEILDLLRKKKI
jgi:5-formyltetrahydrofolate cyclo-ligase